MHKKYGNYISEWLQNWRLTTNKQTQRAQNNIPRSFNPGSKMLHHNNMLAKTHDSKDCALVTTIKIGLHMHPTFNQIGCKRKKEEIWISPTTKAPIPTEISKGQRDNTNTSPKSSITQRLWTDLGRSVGVITVTQLVWFTGFTGPTFPLTATV